VVGLFVVLGSSLGFGAGSEHVRLQTSASFDLTSCGSAVIGRCRLDGGRALKLGNQPIRVRFVTDHISREVNFARVRSSENVGKFVVDEHESSDGFMLRGGGFAWRKE